MSMIVTGWSTQFGAVAPIIRLETLNFGLCTDRLASIRKGSSAAEMPAHRSPKCIRHFGLPCEEGRAPIDLRSGILPVPRRSANVATRSSCLHAGFRR